MGYARKRKGRCKTSTSEALMWKPDVVCREYIIDTLYTFTDTPGLWSLFFSAFLSSTLLPGSSEAVLLWMTTQQSYAPLSLLGVATLGNTLGGLSSWGLGYLLAKGWLRRKTPSKPSHEKALQRLQRYGSPILLLSWLPLIGDPLCLAAGYIRCNFWSSALFIAIGKAARYAALIGIGNFLN